MSAAFFIPPYPAAIVELLRQRGHEVTIRQNKHGSLRYRIDGGRELQAIEMDRYYGRKYDPVSRNTGVRSTLRRDPFTPEPLRGGKRLHQNGAV